MVTARTGSKPTGVLPSSSISRPLAPSTLLFRAAGITGVEKPAIVAVVVASVSGCESREATSFAQLSQAAFDAQNTRVDLVEGLGFRV